MKRFYLIMVGVMVLCVATGTVAYMKLGQSETEETVSMMDSDMDYGMMNDGAEVDTTNVTTATKDQLLYLIEEEKLAHDVYTKMYELYGERVFGNILKSESTHQSRVKTLLDARNIADPRSSQIGVFTNTELQNLYNELIAKGSQSEKDAYEVGVAIEEKDIKDISDMLAKTFDTDIVSALESLRSGSENHLRAFNRQLDRIN